MEDFAVVFVLLFALLVVIYFLSHIVSAVIEPFYMSAFERPVYVYFYPILKKLSRSEQHILASRFPFYNRLSEKKKKYFEHRVHHFLNRYEFIGKQGMEITDQVRVMIAATYVMLTFGFRVYLFNVFNKIIVYPDVYQPAHSDELHKGEFNPRAKAVVFSWKHFVEGYETDNDNLNLGIHEFAHILHYYGLKRIDNGAALFATKYEQIMKEINHPPNRQRLIDSDYFRIYAYTSQFEFLAVLLEHFFETPQLFKREFPQLYNHVRIMINYRDR